ncbi:hypothetical protein [Cellulomonas phragmiteti]|uniref:EF-hand domain-containing protein n=1 Tax=Cellulomonas phragmiteti TaxID=478780 RepID=A0ABQ4DGF4_9CELL|nr:hypothetical protein [Cellulomonas phragmiteti]GIG38423.1 hypothetical protein Cph01nite_01850 [Cellulomonas phragmiteti]
MAVVIWILVALLVAAAVLVVVSSGADEDGPWRTFLRGLRGRRHPDAEQAAAARAAAADPVDLSLADFLRATASEGDGYLHPEELVEDLRTARERAAQVVRPRREAAEAQGATR